MAPFDAWRAFHRYVERRLEHETRKLPKLPGVGAFKGGFAKQRESLTAWLQTHHPDVFSLQSSDDLGLPEYVDVDGVRIAEPPGKPGTDRNKWDAKWRTFYETELQKIMKEHAHKDVQTGAAAHHEATAHPLTKSAQQLVTREVATLASTDADARELIGDLVLDQEVLSLEVFLGHCSTDHILILQKALSKKLARETGGHVRELRAALEANEEDRRGMLGPLGTPFFDELISDVASLPSDEETERAIRHSLADVETAYYASHNDLVFGTSGGDFGVASASASADVEYRSVSAVMDEEFDSSRPPSSRLSLQQKVAHLTCARLRRDGASLEPPRKKRALQA